MSVDLQHTQTGVVTWCGTCQSKQSTNLTKHVGLEFVHILQGTCAICSGRVCRLIYRPLPSQALSRARNNVDLLVLMLLFVISVITYQQSILL